MLCGVVWNEGGFHRLEGLEQQLSVLEVGLANLGDGGISAAGSEGNGTLVPSGSMGSGVAPTLSGSATPTESVSIQ